MPLLDHIWQHQGIPPWDVMRWDPERRNYVLASAMKAMGWGGSLENSDEDINLFNQMIEGKS